MDTAQLLIELGAVLLGLGALAHVAGRFGLSPVPLYLLAGLAFGSGGVLDIAAPEGFFESGSEIGVVLLLLLLGLEYSAPDLLDQLRRQAPVGLLDIVLNGLPGAAIALFLDWGVPSALAMFGVTAVSSSGIVAKVLADLGRLGNRETPTVLGILVLEDLAMAVFLPVLTALLATTGAATTVRAILVAVVVVAGVLVVALRHGHLVNRIVPREAPSEVLLLGIFGLALFVAGVAQAIHVSAAVGAFLLGIALSGEVAERVRPLLEPLRDLFAAVFFVFFGLSTDPSALPTVLVPAAALAVIGTVTKMATGWVAARRAGIGPAGRLRAGAALVPRGEFSIVVAGLAASAVHPALAPTAAAYVLIMAVLGPLMPRIADQPAAWLVRRAERKGAPWTQPSSGTGFTTT